MAAFLLALALAPLLALSAERPEDYAPGVLATGPQGATNPAFPIMPTTIDQNSMARLLSINSIDDWCIFAPPWPATIPDTEDIEVAWCIQPRNNARVIPDGTVHGVTFLRTPYYVQVMGFGDFTRINILPNDAGGELDPYGALELGNPKGGNVSTTQINGRDVPLQEWMMFINWEFFCLRVCTNSNATYSTARMCWHELDIMGCEFVMPGQYNFQGGIFESCDADSAYPPGVYPIPNPDGSTSYSTFAQYFTGVYTGADGQPTGYTVGDTVTPAGPATTPHSSNCVTQATIGNGLAQESVAPGARGTAPPPGFTSLSTTFVNGVPTVITPPGFAAGAVKTAQAQTGGARPEMLMTTTTTAITITIVSLFGFVVVELFAI